MHSHERLLVATLTVCCFIRRQLTDLEAERSLVAGLRCEIDELHQSHAAQLEQYSEKTRALVRYCICSTYGHMEV